MSAECVAECVSEELSFIPCLIPHDLTKPKCYLVYIARVAGKTYTANARENLIRKVQYAIVNMLLILPRLRAGEGERQITSRVRENKGERYE